MSTLLAAALLLQAAAATPAPAPPKLAGGFGVTAKAPTKARVVLTDYDLRPTGTGHGTFSVAGASGPAPDLSLAIRQVETATDAQKRMTQAVDDGVWTAGNIIYHEGIRGQARENWDAAAEECRRTPGCKPMYRPAAVLPTGAETVQKVSGPKSSLR